MSAAVASCPLLERCVRQDTKALTLILARHGQQVAPPMEGVPGPPLTRKGERQADRLARRIEGLPLDQIYCSDMARAQQTAEAVRVHHPDVPFEVLTDLREINGHHLPGQAPARTAAARERLAREREAIARFVTRLHKRHGAGQAVLVVAHGTLMRVLVPTLAGIAPRQSVMFTTHHTSLTVLSLYDDQPPRIRLANCTRHLTPRLLS